MSWPSWKVDPPTTGMHRAPWEDVSRYLPNLSGDTNLVALGTDELARAAAGATSVSMAAVGAALGVLACAGSMFVADAGAVGTTRAAATTEMAAIFFMGSSLFEDSDSPTHACPPPPRVVLALLAEPFEPPVSFCFFAK